MRTGTLAPYERALAAHGQLRLQFGDGTVQDLDTTRYLGEPDQADHSVLARCRTPTIDLGCGPGRLASALLAGGTPALGVDIAPIAVELARARGACVLLRDLFAQMPGEGRWSTVLLIDGNVGIAGAPDRLLARAAALMSGDGDLIVEADPDEVDVRGPASFAGVPDAVFDWARAGATALTGYAEEAGLSTVESWSAASRSFLRLRRTAPRT